MGVTMSVCRFDTFEDEAELLKLIKNLQSKSIEYMKIQEPWDLKSTKNINLKETVPV